MKKLALLISFAAFLNVSFLSFQVSFLYYPILIFAFGLIVAISNQLSFNSLHIWLIISAVVSILMNEIPEIFKPYERLAIFITIGGLVGPLIISPHFVEFRKRLFYYLNTIIIAAVTLSALGNILRIPLFFNYSGFSGLFNQSMMMGPMAAISFLLSLYSIREAKTLKKRRFYYLICFLSFYACVAAGSRGALIAGLGGFLFFLFLTHRKNIGAFTRSLLLIGLVGIFTYPLWESQTTLLQKKIEYSKEEGGFTATRNDLWEERVLEFQSSPIFGVGFASIDPTITKYFDEVTGTVEPGSSWLALLSMVGILGFLPFTFLIIIEIRSIYYSINHINQIALIGSLLTMFIIHMLGEGYILSAGSGLFFYLWLVIGIAAINRKEAHNSDLKISYLQQ